MTTCLLCNHQFPAGTANCPRCGAAQEIPPAAPLVPHPFVVEDELNDRTIDRSRLLATPPPPFQPTPPPFQPTPPPFQPTPPAGAMPTSMTQPVNPAPMTSPGRQPAPLGLRFGAALLDGVILTAMILPVQWLISAIWVSTLTATYQSGAQLDLQFVQAGMWSTYISTFLISLTIGVVYRGIGDGSGQTWGKKAVGLRVIDINTGAPIGFARAAGRYLVLVFTSLICMAGYFSVFLGNGRGWHDQAVDTVVVQDR